MAFCGKVCHASEESADVQAASLSDRVGVRPNVYYCDSCKAWHVGFTYEQRRRMSKRDRRLYYAHRGR